MDREHRPVLLEEAIAALMVSADGAYVDGTFGRGGHSTRILDALSPLGTLAAFDQDPAASAVAERLAGQDSRFRFQAANFRDLANHIAPASVQGVLQPERGSAAERRVQLQASAQRRRLPPPRPPVPGVGRHQTTRMGGTGQNAAAHAATDRATPRYKHAVSNSERRSSGRRRPREAGPSGPSRRVEPRPATPGIQRMRRATPSATWTSLARPLPRERGGYLYLSLIHI